ncbi:44219_t:CDS:2 [Gigaspora margarita]|uniref:44219_t:CDS:1 n=1 Tax=Gigaspora margarita TaxID=4874 RepID=A0ABN7VCR6_GIGMA|nr:44219_t:CDS:2 [Gigaspora margarita]
MLVEDGLMVVEFANDSNLREYLEANFSRLYWVDKFRIAKQILQGLTFLHANNLVHREDQINTFNYSEFSNPEKIADGLCKLEWKNYGMTVALKSLKTEISPTELLLLQKVAHHPNINSFYGLTKGAFKSKCCIT